MSNQKLRIWRTAGVASVLSLRSIGTFPFTWLFVIAALSAVRVYRLPGAWHDLPAFTVWGSVLGMLASTAVLTPFAIMIHRWIVLGERENSYWATLIHARTVRFLGALLLLTLVRFLPEILAGWLQRPVGERALYLPVSLTVSALLWTRLCLGFPIIATENDATLPFRESFYVTSGSSLRILFVFIVIGAVELVLSMLTLRSFTFETVRASLWFDVAWKAVDTFFFAIYVAVASHLWRTRGDWSDRSSAVSAALTTSTIP
jgi:hypothetical protein